MAREMEAAEAVSGGGAGGGGRPGGMGVSGPGPEQTASYTVPGVLHFIKHEWSRFERERANWEVERAELQVCTYTPRERERRGGRWEGGGGRPRLLLWPLVHAVIV